MIKHLFTSVLALMLIMLATTATEALAADNVTIHADHLIFHPQGEANGKHIVLIAGDEEYRSEEAMPMMAEVLARHGFKCTVLFSLADDGKTVDPNQQTSLSSPASS